ncbi:shufflon system plasmid conjugative transfer pilus tip adhesin PilV [Bilophila wadsworthia]|jgi:prepilin-type N-terminal cleavage/methylation domain-containing protein|uniref:shufflon system plasmid conjugative transfer pilus tip adhesin PilV n=1 Tax=Bilophila wadsworthia TaxID=35833 RepID=UPI001D0BD05B|nr:shufflon system plasmid conjugative transfer pilus tip adhesin PilV [Bilophila wadsworthia]MCB8571746.1 shufflon system plasmid conjugative transfer pilus tip adhesin PilV [Bilophila wadsworthia]
MKKTKQSGFTLIELVIALTVIGVLMPIVYQHWQIGYIAEQQSHAADQLRQVNDASDAYIKRHFDTLLSSTTPSSGPQITIDQLVNDGLLPEGFRNSNIWGQSYEIYVRKPHENTLNSITITRGGREHKEGDSFATLTVPGAALRLGGAGGFVPTGALPGQQDGTLHGAAGGFILDLAALGITSPGPGHLGAYSAFDEYDLGTDYLYRGEVPGHPEYNQMQTELDMTGHGIENVGSVQYVSRTVTDGESCSTEDEGKMFLDELQGMYLCRNGMLVLMADTGNSTQFKMSTVANNGDRIAKPSCAPGTGTSPQIYVAPAIASSGSQSPAMSALQAWATSVSATEWQVHLRVLNTSNSDAWVYPTPEYGRVMVFTTCTKQ